MNSSTCHARMDTWRSIDWRRCCFSMFTESLMQLQLAMAWFFRTRLPGAGSQLRSIFALSEGLGLRKIQPNLLPPCHSAIRSRLPSQKVCKTSGSSHEDTTAPDTTPQRSEKVCLASPRTSILFHKTFVTQVDSSGETCSCCPCLDVDEQAKLASGHSQHRVISVSCPVWSTSVWSGSGLAVLQCVFRNGTGVSAVCGRRVYRGRTTSSQPSLRRRSGPHNVIASDCVNVPYLTSVVSPLCNIDEEAEQAKRMEKARALTIKWETKYQVWLEEFEKEQKISGKQKIEITRLKLFMHKLNE